MSEEQCREVLAATDAGRTLDAYHLALQLGPLESWRGPEAMALAARLARHLGGSDLGWRLAQRGIRAYPGVARVRLQHFYGVMEQRGHFSAWHYLPRLEQCPTDVPLEKAEILVARADILLIYRDFETAGACFAKAQALAPNSPWIWTASAEYWHEQNRLESCLPFLDHALALQPWFRPAVQSRAQLLQSLGRDDEALAFLEEARHHLQFSGIAGQLVSIHSERENWKAMLEAVADMRAKSPLATEGAQAWFLSREADALIGLGDLSGAAEKAEAAGAKMGWYKKLAERVRGIAIPGRRVKIDVPHIRQDYNTCAPATLAAVTTFWQRPIAQETLIDEICYDGTTAVAERRWVEANGWYCREFKVDWDITTALLDLGLPFILSTQEIESGHAQCIIGYDTVRGTILIRDPSVRHHTEMSYAEFIKHYEPVGPRGLLVLPPEKAPLVAAIDFPEAALYDLVYEIASALEAYDRPRADKALAQLAEAAPGHRHYWMACRAMAAYDQNPVLHLEAVDKLRELYPDDDRLIHVRVALLRHLGRMDEARATLQERLARRGLPMALWTDYAEEQSKNQRGSNTVLRMAWRRLKRQPQNGPALARYSTTLWESLRKEEALAVQRLAVSLGDKNEQAAGIYFRMLLGLGRSEEGVDFLRHRASRLLPLSGDPALTLAESLHQLHRTHEAREALAAALQQRPRDGALLLYSAQIEAIAAQPQQSEKLLADAASCTNRIVWLRTSARLHRRAGNQEQSLHDWNELAQTAPLDLEAHQQIALLLARREGRPAGIAYIQKIGLRFPQHIGLLQMEIGWLYGHADADLERRLVEFVTANPYNAWAQRELVLFLQRRYPGSIDESLLQRAQFARQIDPSNPNSWLIESSVLLPMGRQDEARKCIRHALELWIDNGAAQQQLLILGESEDDKKESLAFIRQQIERQEASGNGIAAYREVAFPVLPMDELTSHLRDFHLRRPEAWETSKALITQLIAAGKLDEAQEVASAATQRFPLLADTWQQLGIILEHRGQRGAAIDYFRFVLQLEPERFSAIYHLAGAYRHENRTPEALDLLEKAQQRDPLSARLAGTYAENLWHLERRQEAIDAVRRAVEVDPDYQWGLDALSRWSRSVSRHDLALELCRERAERLQHDSAAWLHVARLAHGPGHGATHLNAALRARACDPFNVDVHDTVAVAFVRQRRYTEALEACWPPEFSGRNPLNLRGREAWIFAQRGDLDKAIAAMKELVQINPQYVWGWDMLIDWQARKKDLPAALAACERMVRLMPLVASGYLRRAEIQLQLKKETEAKRDLRRAFALAPMPAAGWRLLRLQLDGHEYPAAEETLRLMQPHIAQATMLPARMLAAAHRGQINVALDIFAEMVALPEVDANALNQAIQIIDGQKRGDLLNARLGTLMKHPQLNPFLAAVWVARRGLHFKWKLMGQYTKLTQQTRARASFLKEWLRQTGKSRLGLETARLIRKDCADLAQQDTQVWGNLGRVLVATNQYREAMEWLGNWRERPDVEGWMVTNLVYSYHGLDRRKEADETSREILERGLRDHTTAIHLSYLAISALEAHHTAEARSLFGDIEVENQRPDQFYISRLIEAALLVQEAASPQEKTSVYLAQKPRISAKRPGKALGRTAVAQERRCLAIMASDAGNPLPMTMSEPELPLEMPPLPPPAPGEEDSVEVPVRTSSQQRPSGRRFIRYLRLGLFLFGVFAVIVKTMIHLAIQPAPLPASTAGSPSSYSTVPSPAQPASSDLVPSLPGHGKDSSGLSTSSLSQLAVDNIDQGGPVQQAFNQLDAAVHRAPNDTHILCLVSEIALRFRKFNQAVGLAQRAVSQDPNDSRALGDLALPLIFTNRLEESVTAADRALAIDPKNASALAAKGIAACLHRDWDHASDLISQSIDADPQKDLPWLFIDTIYRGSNRLSDGEAKVRELLQKHPDSEPGWYALGVVLNQEKMADPAMDAFNHAKLINPNDYLLWNGIGLALGNSNDLDKAADAFKRSISLYGGYDEAWNNLGYTQLQQGNTEDAIESFKKTLAVNPRHTKALINLTHAYIKAGQREEARKTCDLLATIDPKTADSIRTEIP